MTAPLLQLLQGTPLELPQYPPNSRYHGIAQAAITLADERQGKGRTVRYLRRRFLPDASMLVTLAEHRVADGERLDHLAFRYLGDPSAAWRIADANFALRMEALVEVVGRRLRITLPAGTQDRLNA